MQTQTVVETTLEEEFFGGTEEIQEIGYDDLGIFVD